nr:uncharacterized protein LOC109427210 isoform X1 [Aedes albopictus]
MVVACAVVTCRNHNKNCDLSFFQFPQLGNARSTSEQEQLKKMRLAMWRKASGYRKSMHPSVRICGRHFVSGRPAKLDEPGSIDWVPTLHLPEQPPSRRHGADAEVLAAEKEKAEIILGQQKTICSIKNCSNNKSPSKKTKIYSFPKLDTTNYVRRVLSEKRLLLWCQMVNRRTQWDKLCSLHFVSGTMADLTDVENVDWIPTVNVNKKARFTDHVAYFNLYNLISLVKESDSTGKCVTIDTCNKPQQDAKFVANTISSTVSKPMKEPVPIAPRCEERASGADLQIPIAPKISVRMRCILCLASTALRPLNEDHRKAIDLLFKNKLQVDSKLICTTCSKAVLDFFIFYNKVLDSQQKAKLGKGKSVVKVDQVRPLKRVSPADGEQASVAPEAKKPRSTNEKATVMHKFRCKICYVTFTSEKGLTDHLCSAHKVKISCKLCKNSFSPDDFKDHKADCFAQNKAQRKPQRATAVPATATTPSAASKPKVKPTVPTIIVLPKPNEKHSCYICKEFYTPSEMTAHVKTHINTVPKHDPTKDFVTCKQCNKAFRKQNMSRHLESHERHRNQMSQLVTEDESKEQTVCDKCGKLLGRFGLEAHRATTCGDVEVSSCDSHLIKGHVNKVHWMVLVKCRFCPNEYTSKDLATNHERRSHREAWEEKNREGVKRFDLDRDQSDAMLSIQTNTNEEQDSETCPVGLNVHGAKSHIEAHVRKSHSSDYLSIAMSDSIVNCGEDVVEDFSAAEDFDAAQYISTVLGSSTPEADAI